MHQTVTEGNVGVPSEADATHKHSRTSLGIVLLVDEISCQSVKCLVVWASIISFRCQMAVLVCYHRSIFAMIHSHEAKQVPSFLQLISLRYSL